MVAVKKKHHPAAQLLQPALATQSLVAGDVTKSPDQAYPAEQLVGTDGGQLQPT